MAIDVRKFINVNITHHEQPVVLSSRDTAVLITSEGTPGVKFLATSITEWNNHVGETVFTNTRPYVEQFFAHGGVKLLVVEGATGSDLITMEDKYIVGAVVGQTLSQAKALATSLDNLVGVHRKLLITRVEHKDIYIETLDELGQPTGNFELVNPELSGLNSLIVKYTEHKGAEMAVAAYLTRVDVYGTNTVHDYAFTKESIPLNTINPINNSLFDILEGFNFNFNISLAGANRNVGGNLTNGRPVINEFMLIVLHQTVTDQLLSLLVTKVKGNQALSAMRTILSQELNRYVTNGYLDTNKTWNAEDWKVTHNAQEFLIITKDTPLPLGYWIQVLPWNSLDKTGEQAKQTPPIYIVVSDSFGIRKIEVIGGVI